MSVVVVTGSCGLVGSEAVRFFGNAGHDVVGIDNDLRSSFFGENASNRWQRSQLESELGNRYTHCDMDIRDSDQLSLMFKTYGTDVALVVHTAAQPSHDWAAREPFTDFSINANGTLNLLESLRQNCPDAVFIFTSTNKVYGDTPNQLPLEENETRWEIPASHKYAAGISEDMSIDQSLHSLFGASKVAADVLVQEYGRYFGIRTAAFRGGCLTGPNHSGAQLHGFLSYLVQCAATNTEYIINGYEGKQVRDNIHSADLIAAFDAFFQSPRVGEVYNIGGGRTSNCSVLEAIANCETLTDRKMVHSYNPTNRIGDHKWWISDTSKFESHYPNWSVKRNIADICKEIYEANCERWVVS